MNNYMIIDAFKQTPAGCRRISKFITHDRLFLYKTMYLFNPIHDYQSIHALIGRAKASPSWRVERGICLSVCNFGSYVSVVI